MDFLPFNLGHLPQIPQSCIATRKEKLAYAKIPQSIHDWSMCVAQSLFI